MVARGWRREYRDLCQKRANTSGLWRLLICHWLPSGGRDVPSNPRDCLGFEGFWAVVGAKLHSLGKGEVESSIPSSSTILRLAGRADAQYASATDRRLLTAISKGYSYLYFSVGKIDMVQVSYSELRQNLARYLDEAVDNLAPILVTRQNGKGNVVILSEEEFEGWQETVHLLRSPANATWLLNSVRSADDGDLAEHALEAEASKIAP